MAKQLSLEEQKQRNQEMHAFLRSIPMANGPILYYDVLVQEMTVLEKTLNKLKTFINFLSKLNPKEYLAWMKEAYARYTAPTFKHPEGQSEPTASEEPYTSMSLPSPKHWGGKGRKKKKTTMPA